MLTIADAFDAALREAVDAVEPGWDLTFLERGFVAASPSWDYGALARAAAADARTVVDIGTGGGEFLRDLLPLGARRVIALEGFEPNVPIARRNLEPRGVEVIQVPLGVYDAYGPGPGPDGFHPERKLPLADASVDVVLVRHSGFAVSEAARVLRRGGVLVNEGIGPRNMEQLRERFVGPHIRRDDTPSEPPPAPSAASLTVVDDRDELLRGVFLDVAAVAYYLLKVPWHVADFCVERYRTELLAVDDAIAAVGALEVTVHRSLLVARKD